MVLTCCPYSPVLQEERFALHKLGIHMRAVVNVNILDDVREGESSLVNQLRACFTI